MSLKGYNHARWNERSQIRERRLLYGAAFAALSFLARGPVYELLKPEETFEPQSGLEAEVLGPQPNFSIPSYLALSEPIEEDIVLARK